tara:strand:- start:1028 stop:1384 length:357 start_codon:yes stop_codon:yes gene_type:complete
MRNEKGHIGKIVGEKVATVFGLWTLLSDPHALLEKIGLSCDTVYKHVPDACYICGHTEFANLSLLGICKKPVFYECDECGALHLRYKQDWIEGQFHNLTDSFTNPSDWEKKPPPDELN